MANEVTKTTTMSVEAVLDSQASQSLRRNLHLSDTQIAKANAAFLNMMNDPKLYECTTMSKLRFAYVVASKNYANDKAIAGVPYGKSIQAQVQYQGLIEDMQACGGVKDVGWNKVYKGIDYKAFVNSADCVELTIPTIKLDDPFKKLEVIGYYCYAICNNGKTYTCLMSVEEAKEWASRYSIAYKGGKKCPWLDSFDDMAIKTTIRRVATQVLKIYPFDRLQASLNLDQAVFDDEKVSYADNPQVVEEVQEVIEEPKQDKTTIINVDDAVKTE